MHGGIIRHLHLQLELLGSILGDGSTEDTSPIAHHEVDLLWSHLLCGDDEVTFILTILIIYDDDELSLTEVLESLLDCVQLDFTHISIFFVLPTLPR